MARASILHLCSRDRWYAERGVDSRDAAAMPNVNRPPKSRCMMVAHDAVISGWRVL